MDTSRISPTAHYTGTIWARAGLSHPALSGALSPTLFYLARPVLWAARPLLGGLSLDGALLKRHQVVEARLEAAIAERGVRQVVEIAAGLSARGLRVSARHDLPYIEGDLPGMAARKRAALDGVRGPRHHVVSLNALLDQGPESLVEATAGLLDPTQPVAVITEGLLLYLPRAQVEALWARIARFLGGFPSGVYLTDLISKDALTRFPLVGAFFGMLSVVARGKVAAHYGSPDEAAAVLRAAGFGAVEVHDASGGPASPTGMQQVLEAWVG